MVDNRDIMNSQGGSYEKKKDNKTETDPYSVNFMITVAKNLTRAKKKQKCLFQWWTTGIL